MTRAIGMLILIVCGSLAGRAVSAEYMSRTRLLREVSEMLMQLSIMLAHDSPTVDKMLLRLSAEVTGLPYFMCGITGRRDLTEILSGEIKGLDSQDRERLREYFLLLGSADKTSEQQRTEAVKAYFARRMETEQPKNEKSAGFAQKLGILGGIFAAVMLM